MLLYLKIKKESIGYFKSRKRKEEVLSFKIMLLKQQIAVFWKYLQHEYYTNFIILSQKATLSVHMYWLQKTLKKNHVLDRYEIKLFCSENE